MSPSNPESIPVPARPTTPVSPEVVRVQTQAQLQSLKSQVETTPVRPSYADAVQNECVRLGLSPLNTLSETSTLVAKTLAEEEERRTGVPALATLAQWALESGYGKSKLSQNALNFFGKKASSKDPTAYWSKTREGSAGEQTINAAFRSYPSIQDSFQDHSNLLINWRYSPALRQFQMDHDVSNYIRNIAKAGYCTLDSNEYARRCMSALKKCYQTLNLPFTEQGPSTKPAASQKQVSLVEQEASKVQSGANSEGLSELDLQEFDGPTDDEDGLDKFLNRLGDRLDESLNNLEHRIDAFFGDDTEESSETLEASSATLSPKAALVGAALRVAKDNGAKIPETLRGELQSREFLEGTPQYRIVQVAKALVADNNKLEARHCGDWVKKVYETAGFDLAKNKAVFEKSSPFSKAKAINRGLPLEEAYKQIQAGSHLYVFNRNPYDVNSPYAGCHSVVVGEVDQASGVLEVYSFGGGKAPPRKHYISLWPLGKPTRLDSRGNEWYTVSSKFGSVSVQHTPLQRLSNPAPLS